MPIKPTPARILALACEQGDLDAIRAAIEEGADPNAHYKKGGHAPLVYAAKGGQALACRFLLESGADIERTGDSGTYPLAGAVASRQEVVVEQLLQANPSFDQCLAAAALAASTGRTEMLKSIIDVVPVGTEQRRILVDKCLLESVHPYSSAKLMTLLLELGANPNAVDENGRTTLHRLTTAQSDRAAVLLAYGADPTMQDAAGLLPMIMRFTAILPEISRLVEVIRNRRHRSTRDPRRHRDNSTRTKPSKPDKAVIRALDQAAVSGDIGLLRGAFSAGIPPDVSLHTGLTTAMHRAAAHGRTEVVEYLIQVGADVNRSDRQGRTALHLAATQGHPAIVQMLLDAGADPNAKAKEAGTPLSELSANSGSAEAARILLAAGADPNVFGFSRNAGNTPLHNACYNHNTELCELLVTSGSDPNRLNGWGDTPGHDAIRFVSSRKAVAVRTILELLLAHGADMTIPDGRGRTVSEAAVRADPDGAFGILVLFKPPSSA